MRQRIYLRIAFDVSNILGAGQRVGAVDIHRTRAAHAFPARASEREGRVHLVFNFDQRIKHHWPAIIHIDFKGVELRIFILIGIIAIDLKLLDIFCTIRGRMGLTFDDTRVFRQVKFNHFFP